jgi:hypothetical protein
MKVMAITLSGFVDRQTDRRRHADIIGGKSSLASDAGHESATLINIQSPWPDCLLIRRPS